MSQPVFNVDAFSILTRREVQVLDLIALGLTAKLIALELSISEHTVRVHRENLRRKLGVRNTAQLGYYHAIAKLNGASLGARAAVAA